MTSRRAAPDAPPIGCEHEPGCITCGDEASEMRILGVDSNRGLALCADRGGVRSTVETALVAPVSVGETLLVHAGTAIARLSPTGAPR
ncbi:MAG: HypC/HybG/HupF family hydrogenase formation chaperone [Solirubrobacterales bacterium]